MLTDDIGRQLRPVLNALPDELLLEAEPFCLVPWDNSAQLAEAVFDLSGDDRLNLYSCALATRGDDAELVASILRELGFGLDAVLPAWAGDWRAALDGNELDLLAQHAARAHWERKHDGQLLSGGGLDRARYLDALGGCEVEEIEPATAMEIALFRAIRQEQAHEIDWRRIGREAGLKRPHAKVLDDRARGVTSQLIAGSAYKAIDRRKPGLCDAVKAAMSRTSSTSGKVARSGASVTFHRERLATGAVFQHAPAALTWRDSLPSEAKHTSDARPISSEHDRLVQLIRYGFDVALLAGSQQIGQAA